MGTSRSSGFLLCSCIILFFVTLLALQAKARTTAIGLRKPSSILKSRNSLKFFLDSKSMPKFREGPIETEVPSSSSTVSSSTSSSESELLKIDLKYAFCGETKAEAINLREITILQLQTAFKTKQLTSEQLVTCYLQRIKYMNPYLNAILEINPDAISIAQKLDKDRANGIYYGPLHGIPVLLKDSIGTNDKMETTAGTNALLGLKPKQDAEVVRRLRKAGAVIIGKANLSELSFFRGTNVPSGWSGRGGQTRNTYNLTADPSGSSSGSAVAVAANLVPVALGGETDGSIISPAAEGSLVGLKPTFGRVSTAGCIGIAVQSQDTIGPIARTVSDAARVLAVISNANVRFEFDEAEVEHNYKIETDGRYPKKKELRIGVLRSPYWENPDVKTDEQLPVLEKILVKLSLLGFTIIDPVEAAPGTNSSITNESELMVLFHEFKYNFNDYLQNLVVLKNNSAEDNTTINNLSDLIKYNQKFTIKGDYNQELLINASFTDGILNSTYIAHRNKNKAAAQNYINFILTKYSLDAIVVPTFWSWQIPAIAGYPHITIPAGFKKNGLPFGISFYSGPNSEETLIYITFMLEKVHKARQAPLFLN